MVTRIRPPCGGALTTTVPPSGPNQRPVSLVAATIWNLYGFAQAVMIGDFVRLNAESFGWSG